MRRRVVWQEDTATPDRNQENAPKYEVCVRLYGVTFHPFVFTFAAVRSSNIRYTSSPFPYAFVGASHGNLPHVKNFGNQVTLCWPLNNIA
jgi:hypothetical protein